MKNLELRSKKRILITISLFFILAFVVGKPIFSVIQTNQVGKLLYERASTKNFFYELDYYCFISQIDSDQEWNGAVAIERLEKIILYNPKNARAYYMLGEAYCLNKEFIKAIEYFSFFEQMKPGNPNTNMEIGFAYFALANGKKTSGGEITSNEIERNQYFNRSKEAFLRAGINDNSYLNLADFAFDKEEFKESMLLYSLSAMSSPLQEEKSFRKFLLETLFFGVDESGNDEFIIPILSLEDKTEIYPNELFDMRNSSSVPIGMVKGADVAIIYSTKAEAAILVNIPSKSTYKISISAYDLPPEPTVFQMKLDFLPIKDFELTAGDGELKTWNLEKEINSGIHIFSIRLLNDAIENEKDRNLYIRYLSIISQDM